MILAPQHIVPTNSTNNEKMYEIYFLLNASNGKGFNLSKGR